MVHLQRSLSWDKVAPSTNEDFFKIKFFVFWDTFILKLHTSIIKKNDFQGDLSSISAKKPSLPSTHQVQQVILEALATIFCLASAIGLDGTQLALSTVLQQIVLP